MTDQLPDFTAGFAEVDGTRLYYEAAGSGAPVVLVHGFSLDTRMWDGQFARLARKYRAVRYDARGFGRSVPATGAPYSHSDDLRALLDALEIDAAHLVGLSMGGRIIVDFAVDHPNRLLSLVPVDSVFSGAELVTEFRTRLAKIVATANEAGMDAALELWMADDLFAPAVRNPVSAGPLREIVSGYSGWHWTSGVPAVERETPAAELLGTINVPVLVIVGELDLPEFHDMADVMAARIPGARKAVLPGAGHMSNMEDPAGFNALLEGFLSRLP